MMPGRRAGLGLLRLGLRTEQKAILDQARAPYSAAPAGPARTPGPKPAPAAGPATAPTAASEPGSRAGITDPYTLIPLIGLPAAALWYGYQLFVQYEHDARINAVHDSIRQTRETMQQPFANAAKLPATAAEVKQAASGAPLKPVETTPAVSQSAASDVPQPAPAVASVSTTTPAPATSQSAASTASDAQSTSAPASQQTSSSVAVPAAEAAPEATPMEASIQAAADEVLGAITHVSQEAESTLQQAAQAPPPPPQQQEQQQQQRAAGSALQEGMPAASTSLVQTAFAAAAAQALVGSREPVLKRPNEAEVPAIRKGTMGVALDLTPAGLIQFAIERGMGPGQDWAAFAEHHKQAVADAELLSRAANQIAAWHEKEVASVRSEAEAHAKRAEDILDMAKKNAEQFKRLLRQHQDMAAELRLLEVTQAEKRATLAASKALEEARLAQTQALDTLRLDLGALAGAHEARVSQQAASRLLHGVTLSVLALGHALDNGQPLQQQLTELLQRAAAVEAAAPPSAATAGVSDTSLVRAAALSIPTAAANKGIPTLTELGNRLRAMKGAVTTLAMLPDPSERGARSGGILTHAFARLFAWLKADESGVVRALGPDAALSQGGVASALAAAEQYLAEGKLAEAAHVMAHSAQGSGAAVAVQGWCADVAARAKADQAVKLLRAHASVLAASAM